MPHYLSDDELRRLTPAETLPFKSPVPMQVAFDSVWSVDRRTA